MPDTFAPPSTGGILAPYTIYPPLGPTGIVPPRDLKEPGIPPPTGSGGGMGLHPGVPLGGGYLSRLADRAQGMDLVRGLDRLLGKTAAITPGHRQAQSMKIITRFSVQEALGKFSGRLAFPWGGKVDITA